MTKAYTFLLFTLIFLSNGCSKKNNAKRSNSHEPLTVKVKNITPRTLYTTCFAHMKKQFGSRWRWHKTKVYKLKPHIDVVIPIGNVANKYDRSGVYGALGIFTDESAAHDAIYELLPDQHKLDLDQIEKLKDQTVLIGVEKYGITGDIFDYDFVGENEVINAEQELDFVVENKTGRNIYATAFAYQVKEDMPTWRYDKTPIVFIKNGESAVIDIDTLSDQYDRRFMRGYLAVFDEGEEHEAHNATYQLLKPYQKVKLGRLSALQERKIILTDQKYGILGDMINFTIKEPSKPRLN